MKTKLRNRVLRNLKDGITTAESLYDTVRDAHEKADDREEVLRQLNFIREQIDICSNLISDDLREYAYGASEGA